MTTFWWGYVAGACTVAAGAAIAIAQQVFLPYPAWSWNRMIARRMLTVHHERNDGIPCREGSCGQCEVAKVILHREPPRHWWQAG